MSLLEIFGGIILSGGAALVVSKTLTGSESSRRLAGSFLPLTYIVMAMLPLFLLNWAVLVGYWHTLALVTCLTFFPFMHVFWGLREYPLVCRLLLAADEALPFGFVAMLFGESMNAVAGLGFFTVVARTSLKVDQAIASSMITLVLFILLSAILRGLAKRLYFPPALAVSNSMTQPALSR